MQSQNDDLTLKLRRTDAVLARVKEELANFRASNGRSPFINFDEEQRLSNMLKVSKHFGLCFSVFRSRTQTTCFVNSRQNLLSVSFPFHKVNWLEGKFWSNIEKMFPNSQPTMSANNCNMSVSFVLTKEISLSIEEIIT